MTFSEYEQGTRTDHSPPARLSSLPVVTRSHKLWCAILGALFAFDVVDIYSFSYVAPAIAQEWNLSEHSIGIITSVSFLGMFVGGALGGQISDRFGRKKTIIGAVMVYSLFSLLTTVASNIGLLIVVRLLTGFGIQAMTGVLIVYVAEMFPRHLRGRYQSLLLGLGLIGVPIVAWFARFVISVGPGMWRWVFVVGALGAIVGVAAIRVLPESVRWQYLHGDEDAADATVLKLEAEARAATGAPLPTPSAEPIARPGRVAELMRGRNLRNFTVMCTGSVLIAFAFFGYNAYVPTLLVAHGYSTSQTLTFSSIFSIAAVPGAFLAWPLVDRWERKLLIFIMTVTIGILFVIFGIAGSSTLVLVVGFVISLLLQTQTVFLYAYLPEMFPTHLRGAGAGAANGLGRVGVFAGGFIFAALLGAAGFTGYFITIAVILALGGAVTFVFGMRTTNRPLVENSGGTTNSLEPARQTLEGESS